MVAVACNDNAMAVYPSVSDIQDLTCRPGKPIKPQLAGHHKPKPGEAKGNSSGSHIVRLWATKSWAETAAFRPSRAGKSLDANSGKNCVRWREYLKSRTSDVISREVQRSISHHSNPVAEGR